MTEKKHIPDIWDSLAFVVWCLIFLVGLFPEAVFFTIREWAWVVSRGAFTNTPWFITLTCAGFLGWFTFGRCRECGDSTDISLGKSVQIMILALAAFLPLQVEQIPLYFSIPIALYRRIILAVVAAKMTAWTYLMILLLRYYLSAGPEVFKNMLLVLPSALLADKKSPVEPVSGETLEDEEE